MKTAVTPTYIETATMDFDKIRSVYVMTLTMLSGKEIKVEFINEGKANIEFANIMLSMKNPIVYDNTGKQ